MTRDELQYQVKQPDKSIADFVESFWMLENNSATASEIIVLPDGRIDLFFFCTAAEPFHALIMGLETLPHKTILVPQTRQFAISLKLLAVEYLLNTRIADLINKAQRLPDGFWDIEAGDLNNFDHFCNKATLKIKTLLKTEADHRKQKLFELIYSSNGSLSVKQLSEQAFWSSRQINRYFNQQFGLSLKSYCTILRFRASFQHIKEGRLFPEQNFADQAHFIKEVKKLAGVNPKQLAQNQNDRFIQFSTLAEE